MLDTVAILSREVTYHDPARRKPCSFRLVSLFWALGVAAFLASVTSPYDDALQQELFRPKQLHITVRPLPSAFHGSRKSGTTIQPLFVAAFNACVAWVVLGDLEPDTATLLAVRFLSSLALRSPPSN